MNKSLFATGLILLATVASFAQSVVITPRRTVYRRPKPMYDSKRTFTVRRPIVKASTPLLSRKITTAIGPEKVLDVNIREEQTEIQWLEEVDCKVLFNQDGVLCVEQWMTGTGAYPDTVIETVVVDIARGVTVSVPEVLESLPRLATLVKQAQEKEVEEAKKEMRSDPDARPDELFSSTDFTVDSFEGFAVDAKGVTFIYDYGFPHVLQALEPAGRYHFTWNQLKPFIRKDGLLARFVR